MRFARAVAVLCFLTVLLAGWQQAADHADDDAGFEAPSAEVHVETRPRGDVQFSICTNGIHRPVDLETILRRALPCDWRPSRVDPASAYGTCRRLFPARRGVVNGTLDLAALATGLHQAGAHHIHFTLHAAGEPAPAGIPWTGGKASLRGTILRTWEFDSVSGQTLPPAFHVRMGFEWSANRLGAPLAFVLFGPALLALWFRQRMKRIGSAPGSGVVWLNWILLGSWLYWISAVRVQDVTGFASGLDFDSSLLTLVIGALVFAVPPLVAIAACLLALAPPMQSGPLSRSEMGRLLQRGVTREAAFVLPLGLFLVASAMFEQDLRTGMLGLAAAYASYRVISWYAWRWNMRRMLALDSGDLRERAAALAAAAGATLKSVFILENRSEVDANAFAMGRGSIALTTALVENMTRREIDSVMAHEMGHLRGKHVTLRTMMFLAYLFVIAPAVAYFLVRAGVPEWVGVLPVIPLLWVLLAARLSQAAELSADTRAVELTHDPEGTIAALARLACITQSPVDWGGMQGSILSHPSIERRVLAVARRFNVPEPRALEILRDPGLLASGPPDRYQLPPRGEGRELVFTSSAALSHLYWSTWFFCSVLLLLLMADAWVAVRGGPLWGTLAFFLALPVVAWWSLAVDDWWDRRFIRLMKRRIEARSHRPTAGTFVALVPGPRVLPLDGLFAWDLGGLRFDTGHLLYVGERVRFSVARSEVRSFEIAKGPLRWFRTYAVVVRCATGAFSLRLADRGKSRALALALLRQMESWRRADEVYAAATEVLKPPDLPALQPETPSRLRVAFALGMRTALLFLGGTILLSASPLIEINPMYALVPFVAPLIYMVVVSPAVLRPSGAGHRCL